jgi:hypothetical protein
MSTWATTRKRKKDMTKAATREAALRFADLMRKKRRKTQEEIKWEPDDTEAALLTVD